MTVNAYPAAVSNMTAKKVEELLSYAKIKPAVNQIEIHPYWRNEKTIAFCRENVRSTLTSSPWFSQISLPFAFPIAKSAALSCSHLNTPVTQMAVATLASILTA